MAKQRKEGRYSYEEARRIIGECHFSRIEVKEKVTMDRRLFDGTDGHYVFKKGTGVFIDVWINSSGYYVEAK